MVVISRPSTRAARERHDLTRLPSIRTVQAPHWPRPQPFLEPVRCKCSRNASSSVVRGSSVNRCSAPFTRSTTFTGAAAAGAAPGNNRSAAKAPPVAAVSFSSSRRVKSKPAGFEPLHLISICSSPFICGDLLETFLKDILGHRYCGKNVRPTGVEEQVCEHLRRFLFRQPVVHRPIQVSRKLRDLTGRDQRADSNEASVARREGGTQP